MLLINGYKVRPALVVIDMQNGFCSKGGSYDKLGMNISHYQSIIPNIKTVIEKCRKAGIPIFYTQAVREVSGIDLLTRRHKILPKNREERIKKVPICVRGTWDAEIVEDLKPSKEDHVVEKRRDSAFHDTELDLWLRSLHVDTVILCGADTTVCVNISVRDAFNLDYDVMVIGDATASLHPEFHAGTLEVIREWFGLVMSTSEFVQKLRTV
ncbi:MAG: cysteine hydrolase family protein [Nitrososphaerales archaeon]